MYSSHRSSKWTEGGHWIGLEVAQQQPTRVGHQRSGLQPSQQPTNVAALSIRRWGHTFLAATLWHLISLGAPVCVKTRAQQQENGGEFNKERTTRGSGLNASQSGRVVMSTEKRSDPLSLRGYHGRQSGGYGQVEREFSVSLQGRRANNGPRRPGGGCRARQKNRKRHQMLAA